MGPALQAIKRLTEIRASLREEHGTYEGDPVAEVRAGGRMTSCACGRANREAGHRRQPDGGPVLRWPYSDQPRELMLAWKLQGAELLASTLLEYELEAELGKVVGAGWLTMGLAVEAMGELLALDIWSAAPTAELHERALVWAEREELELWTGDQRLNGCGAAWGRLGALDR